MISMDKPDGEWNFILIRDQSEVTFAREIDKLMNEDWELHGSTFTHHGDFVQALVKFEHEEYEETEGGDDDDGLPLPEAGNEPIEQARNCS